MLVLLIELEKLCSRIAVGLPSTDGRDDVDAPSGPLSNGSRVEVGRERDDVAQVLGRRDDVDPLVVAGR